MWWVTWKEDYLHGSSCLKLFLPNCQKNANNYFISKMEMQFFFFIKLQLYYAAITLKCVIEDCIN